MDALFSEADGAASRAWRRRGLPSPDPAPSRRSPGCSARRSGRCSCSVPMSGSAGPRTRRGRRRRPCCCPVITNGQGRGILPAGHELLVTRARSLAFGEADLVIVVGTPLDFRLGYGEFGAQTRRAARACRAHRGRARPGRGALPAGRIGRRRPRRGAAWPRRCRRAAQTGRPVAASGCRTRSRRRWPRTERCSRATPSPVHPMRIYGELTRILDDDAVVIGDGGDFVSYAGKYVEPKRPGGWLDPGPYGCLGTGPRLRHCGPAGPPGRPGRACCLVTARRDSP